MNIAAVCIRRPVMTTLLMLSFVVVGIFAYRLLPVAALPRVDYPIVEVNADLPGASPEAIAVSVATPLERQFATIPGVQSVTSVSTLGTTRITVQFDLARNIDQAALDVQTAITTASRLLPGEMPAPPSFRKTNPADQPILFIAFTSDTLPLATVNEYAETIVSQRLASLSGVSQVNVYGAQKYAVRVQVNPKSLAARGIGLDEVEQAIAAADSNVPVGDLTGANQSFILQTTGQLANAALYRPLIVAYRDGNPVRLGDIAEVQDSVYNDEAASWLNGTRSILVSIQRQPDANTVEVVDRARELMPKLAKDIPASINMAVLFDRSVSIRDSVRDVQFTLGLTVALVVLVIFLFLRNLSATLIPSLALPISLIGTFAGMYVFDYSIDNLSLLALTLSVGFVVDDAIVMLENIVRHMEMGKKPLQAALDGSREITFTIVSMTLSLVAVFIPVLFMGGLVGRLFREFAVTISMTILISGLVSLTLTPMLGARFLRAHDPSRPRGRAYRAAEGMFETMLAAYEWSLATVLRFRLVTLLLAISTLAASVYLYVIIPKGFFPTEDTGLVFAMTEGNQDISFQGMKERQYAAARIVEEDPAVAQVGSFLGRGGSSVAVNNGRLFFALKPLEERQEPIGDVVQRLREKVGNLPGMRLYFVPVQNINVGGRFSKSQYQYTIQGNDFTELQTVATRLEDLLRKEPGLQDVTSDLQLKSPQMFVDIDRDKAAVLHVTSEQIRNTMFTAYGSREIATIYTPTNDYRVILEFDPRYREDEASLSQLYVRNSRGDLIPLEAFTSVRRLAGPLSINHQSAAPAVTISFNLAPGMALGDAVERIEQVERRANVPPSVTTGFSGTAQVFQDSLRGQGLLILAAVYVMFVVLGVLYESFLHPITILSGLPSAGLGALLTLMLFGMDLSVIALIGIVMLIGIVKKNGIMMVDVAMERRRADASLSPRDAIYEACRIRFRPIMMTTMAAIVGVLPIAIGFGAGSELRRPLGVAVVGGLVVSQLLTLYITPVVYVYLETMRERFRAWNTRGEAAA